jgi:hypothetical protein
MSSFGGSGHNLIDEALASDRRCPAITAPSRLDLELVVLLFHHRVSAAMKGGVPRKSAVFCGRAKVVGTVLNMNGTLETI